MNSEKSFADFYRQVFGGSWITQGIWVAAELGIADKLADGPLTIETLAEQTETNADALYRVLRALAGVGIFAQGEDGRFSLTELGSLLRSDAADSQRPFAIMMGAEFHDTWGELLHSVKTGRPGFEKKYGMHFFQYMTDNPERHSIYDSAMGTFGRTEVGPMLEAYDFGQFKKIVDVGGGSGVLLAAILKRHPAVSGVLFDLPAVADRARETVSKLGLSERCTIEGGNFFSSVTAGADAYVMQHILHDWEDEDAVAILRTCRKAMNYNSRLLAAEMVIPDGNGWFFGKWLDLMMLLVGGRERTEEQYRKLFSAAGLTLKRIVPTSGEISIIEGVRAS